MCALFSNTVLHLTWWPLFRDCTFYSVALIFLMFFFRDNEIWWYEALTLLLIYAAYVTFMKFNQKIEKIIKKVVYKNKVTRVSSTDHLMVSVSPFILVLLLHYLLVHTLRLAYLFHFGSYFFYYTHKKLRA